jgi:plastocyanin domain-containing protein
MRHAVALAVLLAAAPALGAEQKGATPPAAAGQKGGTPSATAPAGKKIQITVKEAGFEPSEIKLKKGEPVTLVFTRKAERTCMTAVDIPGENVKNLKLPLNQPVAVTITPRKAGVEPFHCSAMAMGDGKLVVEE